MKRIILASASKQRKKLLSLLGVKFCVVPSHSKELENITYSCAHLVQHNALKKAQEVAARHKGSIVIGADTVVYAGGKRLILKPRNYADARRILKALFSKAQWVYTGVALIDTDSGKRLVDYEKTKVYMTALTDKEIGNYHRKVHPFDKAGGFDIEGVGSVFIHRIEGCYTNVIGLPMAKLFRMLKKMGVCVLSVCLAVFFCGCTSEYNLATRQQESLLYSTDKEVRIWERVAEQVEEQFEVIEDIDLNERLDLVLERIVQVCDRKGLLYFAKIIDEKEESGEEIINAVSLPGGYIYVFKDLMDKIENDDQLAGVIAHEVGHITARHGVKRLQAFYGAMLVQILSMETKNSDVAAGVSLAISSLFTEYSQQDEFQADQLAVKYMKKAGYDPAQMIVFLEMLKEKQEKDPIRVYSYWRTHPHISRRIAVTNKEITGKLEFKDYLNIIQSDDPILSE